MTLAQGLVYNFSLDDTDHAKFLDKRQITIFPVSERAKPALDKKRENGVRAADHISGIIIETENPDIAIQEIFNQLTPKTGEKIGRVWNSVLSSAKPTHILMGISMKSTWYCVLSPKEEGNFILTISYIIEE